MRQQRLSIVSSALTLLSATLVHAAPPRLVRLVPPHGTSVADTSLKALEFHFDQPMGPGITVRSDDMPEVIGTPQWDEARQVLRVPVRLAPGKGYRLDLNPPDDRGFVNTAGEPLAGFRWRFRTAGPEPVPDLSRPEVVQRLARAPRARSLAGGALRMHHVYVEQARVLLEGRGKPDSIVAEMLVRRVYRKHRAFWRGCVGDEATFREWAADRLVPGDHPMHTRIDAVLRLELDSLFVDAAQWLHQRTGLHPQGEWVLVFGPGATDMGGVGERYMLVDFTAQAADQEAVAAILPHELAHQVRARRGPDPDGGTVLSRAIGEGLACYVAWVHGEGRRTHAQVLGYDEAQWQSGLEREAELWGALNTIAASTTRDDVDRVAARHERLVEGGPPAAGYFLGYRVVQAWLSRQGADRWPQLLRMPVRQVLEESGYDPGKG